jgi:hypothetical protein
VNEAASPGQQPLPGLRVSIEPRAIQDEDSGVSRAIYPTLARIQQTADAGAATVARVSTVLIGVLVLVLCAVGAGLLNWFFD